MFEKSGRKALFSFVYVFSVASVLMLSQAGSATKTSEPKLLGQYGDWFAYTVQENGEKICYMLSFAKSSKGNYTRRGDVYAMVTHRPQERRGCNVLSLNAGYSFRQGATVAVSVGREKFNLMTHGETAWAPLDFNNTIVHAFLKGSTVNVSGRSARGTLTQDVYSLKGSADAYRAICKACRVVNNNLTRRHPR